MNGLMRQDPYREVQSVISGAGAEAKLILKIPNNKDFINLEDCKFYYDLQKFNCQAINDLLLSELYYLRDKIKNYCYAHNFVTYESEPALELEVYDFRDRVCIL